MRSQGRVYCIDNDKSGHPYYRFGRSALRLRPHAQIGNVLTRAEVLHGLVEPGCLRRKRRPVLTQTAFVRKRDLVLAGALLQRIVFPPDTQTIHRLVQLEPAATVISNASSRDIFH